MVQASRKALRSQRRGLTQTEQRRAAEAVAQSAKHLIANLNLRTLGAYWPNDGELSGLPILQEALVLGLTCTLPIISNQSLAFARIGPTTRFHPNRYEILEPIQDADSEVPLLQHDALFMPLVGFNETGARLGMGGGYYDRTLAHCLAEPKRPVLIGLAHGFQQCSFPTNPWDIPLDYVLTPEEIFQIKIE
ncbi:5-formyltetrahydrofolate cyclo-ligase [Pseudomonadales bacterium]|nr:5-formyltetrahydrofolate cyclo-ligase [Pseudomonadales bacterium]